MFGRGWNGDALMKIISEPEFFAKLKEQLDRQAWIIDPRPLQEYVPLPSRPIKSVMGPGRSGAIASVYASHYLGAIWLPAAMKLVPQVLRPVLMIDTASQNGASLRKLASRVKADYQLVLFTEPPRIRFWYELRKRKGQILFDEDSLQEIGLGASYGGRCGKCGFEYWKYRGHTIPCPRCEKVRADNLILQA